MAADDEKLVFLTPLQIEFYKRKMMNGIVTDIIKNTKAQLFGGAVRDMIGRKIRPDNILPQDLDFFTTTEQDYIALIKHVNSTYHVVCRQAQNETYPWRLNKVRIPIFHSSVKLTSNHLCVLMDLVLLEGSEKRQDFDVNTLILSKTGLLQSVSNYSIKEILQHIFKKKAYLLPQNEATDLSFRCTSLIERGWTIVTYFGDFIRIKETKCNNNSKHSARIKHQSTNTQTALCFSCFRDMLLCNLKIPRPIEEMAPTDLLNKFSIFQLD